MLDIKWKKEKKKHSSANAGDLRIQIRSLAWEDLLEKDMATHSTIFAWRIPWIERGAWRATVHNVAKIWTQLKQLSTNMLPVCLL